jgi:ribulose-phosphate 3-epimerase
MSVIVPAILEDTIDAFNNKLVNILRLPDLKRVQIDISDGKFTPRKTVQLSEIDILNPIVEWEAHLMVEDPKEYFFDAQLAGITTVIVHFEAVKEKERLQQIAEELRGMKIVPGLAINPETPVEAIFNSIELFDQVLVLGVHPGYQGQEMDAGVLDKVKKLKNSDKNVIIEIDGGVRLTNVKQLYEAGAEMFVVGSALFDPGERNFSPQQNFEEFHRAMH